MMLADGRLPSDCDSMFGPRHRQGVDLQRFSPITNPGADRPGYWRPRERLRAKFQLERSEGVG
jgi:hypothetical protein